jgi:hypothetical protein
MIQSLHEELSKLGQRPGSHIMHVSKSMDQANPMEFDAEPNFVKRESDRPEFRKQKTNQDVPMTGYDQPIDFS